MARERGSSQESIGKLERSAANSTPLVIAELNRGTSMTLTQFTEHLADG